jgi:hypothetical protein
VNGSWEPILPAAAVPHPRSLHCASDRREPNAARRLAKLGKVEGGDFDPEQRKWSTERSILPDVAAVGG